jgi:hypothetical protein
MTRTGKKLLAAAALSTLAAPGLAAANPNASPAPVSPTTAARVANPPDGCMLKVYDPATRSYWYVGNGKNMPDQASLNDCKQLQAVLTAHDKAVKAPVNAPYKHVTRQEWVKAAVRVLHVPVATTAGK